MHYHRSIVFWLPLLLLGSLLFVLLMGQEGSGWAAGPLLDPAALGSCRAEFVRFLWAQREPAPSPLGPHLGGARLGEKAGGGAEGVQGPRHQRRSFTPERGAGTRGPGRPFLA